VRTAAGLIELPLLAPYLVAVRLAEGEIVADQLDDLDLEPGSPPS
jgi:hypothetical protein